MQTLWCVLRKDTTGVDTARVRRRLRLSKHGSRISRKPRDCGYKLVGIIDSGVDIVVLGVDINVLLLNALVLSVDISVLVSNALVLSVDISVLVSNALVLSVDISVLVSNALVLSVDIRVLVDSV